MTNSEVSRADTATLTAFKLADRVFDLMGQWNTPPLPNTYAVWFAYVSKSNDKLVARIDKILKSNGAIDRYEIDELYNAYIAEEAVEEAGDALRQEIGKEVATALACIEESITSSDTYQTTLDDFDARLPETGSPEAIRGIVQELIVENRRMADQTKNLAEGLRSSQQKIESLEEHLKELSEENLRDPLTRVANRRAFDARLIEEMRNALETSSDLCLIIADLDHFKTINDKYGHTAGDAVLRLCASVLSRNTKRQDLVARYGGEEFALLLPRTSLQAAYDFAQLIRQKIEKLRVVNKRTEETIDSITSSFGVAALRPGMDTETFIAEADKQLYAAKAAGRNQVKAAGLQLDARNVA